MSEKKKAARVPVKVVVLYCVFLYSAWTLYHFALEPFIKSCVENELLCALLCDGLCKNAVWTLPAILLIKKYREGLIADLSCMFKIKKGDLKYLLLIPAFALYISLGLIRRHTPIAWSITVSEIVTVIFVGITEEIVFRGWLLNGLTAEVPEEKRGGDNISREEMREYGSIALNALLFLAIHFPIWITKGEFITNFTSLGFLSILMLSVIFSVVFLRTKNIIIPVILHMVWDLLIFVIY